MSRPLFVGSYFQVTCWANEKEEINALNGNFILHAQNMKHPACHSRQGKYTSNFN